MDSNSFFLLWLGICFLSIPALIVLLGSPWLCAQLAVLGVFTGILTAIPVGFTLKAPQAFACLGLVAWSYRHLYHPEPMRFPWKWTLPFLAFMICILPSFLMLDRSGLSLSESESSLRLLFNYGLLQLFALCILVLTDSLAQIQRLLFLGLLSYLGSLAFGLAQQVLFYAGVYNPFDYVGQHSSIVDFYGPFLRLSPGTFANEYGEILQSVGIVLVAYLTLLPRQQARYSKGLSLLLGLTMVALVLNFTRASWLVFAVGAFGILIIARLRLRALIGIAVSGVLALGLLWYLSQVLLEASLLLSIGQRFGELGQLQSHSAGQRLITWQAAWEAFIESPWIGQGWGRFGNTHNVPLQLLAETGLIGLSAFYGLMAWCGAIMFRAYRASQDPQIKALLCGVGMAFAGCLAFDLTNHGIYHFVLWFCIAIGLALARLSLYPNEPQAAKMQQSNRESSLSR